MLSQGRASGEEATVVAGRAPVRLSGRGMASVVEEDEIRRPVGHINKIEKQVVFHTSTILSNYIAQTAAGKFGSQFNIAKSYQNGFRLNLN